MVATPDRINFGSLTDGRLPAVWNGEAYHAFRDQLSSDLPPEVCRSCSVYAGTF
jgi:hypothetical protein